MGTMSLAGKVVVITGVSEGIGKASMQKLLQAGCKVVGIGLPAAGYEAGSGDNWVRLLGDITDAGVRENLIQTALQRFGTIDILINNAAVSSYALSYDTPDEVLRRLYDVNVFAGLSLVRRVAPILKEKRSGSIVNIGSICGIVTVPWATVYCSTKFAVHGLTQGLRLDLKPHGIHVMLVMPGIANTRIRDNVLHGKPPGSVLKMKLGVSPEYIAGSVIKGLVRQSRHVYSPFILAWPFVKMKEYAPWLMDWYLQSKQR